MLADVDLNDKFDLDQNQIFINGTQALVRLCLLQSRIDRQNGLNTAGFITGYRGSPLGAVDQQFNRSKKLLDKANIIFEEGLNEDLAATALWGTQQAELRGEGAYDGVFGLWYGKGPGVDRSGDAFKHVNLAGTSKHGGVLLVMGDDHTCESSTTCHQSEYGMVDAQIPLLNPANVSEILEYGLHGIALSRYAGVWCGLKCVKDNVESTASIHQKLDQFAPKIPKIELPKDGLNIRLNDTPQTQEVRLHGPKMDAVRAYVKDNKLDRVVYKGGQAPKLGIITTGKSYMDSLQALDALGIDEAQAEKLGIAVYKVAMPYPLEPTGIQKFAKGQGKGLDKIIVVEEKRGLIEEQIKSALYHEKTRPVIIGKHDEKGQSLFQSALDLSPVQVAIGIGNAFLSVRKIAKIAARVKELETLRAQEIKALPINRGLYFCAGCPHSTSTKLPEGARAYAGIGCHTMVINMDRATETYTHMGAEGSNWIGESKFSTRNHVFQNIGDGTFNHSGIMAMRAAVASNCNITYKLLYNDAVALTGGQVHDGGSDVYKMAREIAALGVEKLVFVTDDPTRINIGRLPGGCDLYHRDQLDQVQRDLSQIEGVTALIYDQTCASEKRRRRKRGLMPELDKRAFINEAVCEGCGDCGVASNCVAIQPVETEFGRKRKVDQFACNKDFSCVEGFCPSFVTVEGATLKKATPRAVETVAALPDPAQVATLDRPYSVLITGVGGTGVVTIGQVLGMAAHLEGKGCGMIDMAGLAQKGGSVMTHLKLAAKPDDIKTIRVAEGGADLVIGGDLIVSSGEKALSLMNRDVGNAVINDHEFMPGDFTRNADLKMPSNLMHKRLKDTLGKDRLEFVNSSQLALKLFGDGIASNMFLTGFAYQKGLLPLSQEAIFRAIELNGVAIDLNKRAFLKGREYVANPKKVIDEAKLVTTKPKAKTLDELIDHRVVYLIKYQDQAYADNYRKHIDMLRETDTTKGQKLTHAAAKYLFKLMAYKDEYEVARLYSNGSFKAQLADQFEGAPGRDYELTLHLAPPLLSRPDPATGHIKKRAFGAWILPFFGVLAKLKFLRGTKLDPFGYMQERKMERDLIKQYQNLIIDISSIKSSIDEKQTLAKLEAPEKIRGFGHVKMQTVMELDALNLEKVND